MITHNLLRAADSLDPARPAVARGATLRRQIIHVPARLARPQRRPVLHLPAHWPWADSGSRSGTACSVMPTHHRQPPDPSTRRARHDRKPQCGNAGQTSTIGLPARPQPPTEPPPRSPADRSTDRGLGLHSEGVGRSGTAQVEQTGCLDTRPIPAGYRSEYLTRSRRCLVGAHSR